MKKTFQNLKKVYSYGKEYKSALILETVGSLVGIIIGILLPILVAKQVVYLTDSKWYQLLYMTMFVLIVHCFSALKTVLIRTNTQKFTVGVTEKIQKLLGREILKINQTELDNNSTGTFVTRMTRDTDELANMFTIGFGRCVGIISSLGTFIAVFIISKEVFLFYLVAMLTLTTLHLIRANKMNKKDREKREQQEHVSGLMAELIRGTRDVKMLDAKDSFLKELNKNIKLKNEKYLEMRNVDISYNFIIEILVGIFEFFLLIIFMYLVNEGRLTVAMAIALYSYRQRTMYTIMSSISMLSEEVNSFNLSCERVFSILDNKTFTKETFGKKHIDKIVGNFEFKNVVFSYDNNNTVLDKLSFKVKENKTYGLVGKSGEGKTTIFNLLCKLYNVKSGSILIDGIDINELDEESIRGNITIISQNPYIFNLSIRDNMRLVKSNITDEEMEEACRLACLDDFISTLPDGYDTVVGEGGVTLSGGQRQRLAIARALIQKTKIILFDEATSALDNETQTKIQQAINNMKEDYTIVIIAHRLSTIVNCDKIMILHDGKITASGTHKQLLKTNKDYKKLCETEMIDK